MKIAVIVRSGLADWQKLNVTDVPGRRDRDHPTGEVMGRALRGRLRTGTATCPCSASRCCASPPTPTNFATVHTAAPSPAAWPTAVYTDELFATGNDADNRAAVAAVATAALSLAGLAVVGDRRTVDKALDKLRLHP